MPISPYCSLPHRLHVSTDQSGSRVFKITNCDLRTRPWEAPEVLPYAFTQEGVAMLSSVLRSPRAVQVNIAIMRAFVRLRRMLTTNEALARKLDALERKYDARFKAVFDAIRQLMTPPAAGRRAIGFRARACGDNVGRLQPKPNLRSQAHQGPLRGETRRGPYPLLLFGLCAPLEVLEGLRQLALQSERQAQVGVGKGIVRLDAQGLLEMFDRLG